MINADIVLPIMKISDVAAKLQPELPLRSGRLQTERSFSSWRYPKDNR
jgi:hypothetical protein